MAHFNWFNDGFKSINRGNVKRLWGQVGIAALLAIVLIGIGAPSVSASHILTRGTAHRPSPSTATSIPVTPTLTPHPGSVHTPTTGSSGTHSAPKPGHSGKAQPNASGPSVGSRLWAFGDAGSIESSPAYDNTTGEVFFTTINGFLYAMSASSGALLWRDALTASFADTPPIASMGVVYATSYNGQVFAVSETTGVQIWASSLGAIVAEYEPLF